MQLSDIRIIILQNFHFENIFLYIFFRKTCNKNPIFYDINEKIPRDLI